MAVCWIIYSSFNSSITRGMWLIVYETMSQLGNQWLCVWVKTISRCTFMVQPRRNSCPVNWLRGSSHKFSSHEWYWLSVQMCSGNLKVLSKVWSLGRQICLGKLNSICNVKCNLDMCVLKDFFFSACWINTGVHMHTHTHKQWQTNACARRRHHI